MKKKRAFGLMTAAGCALCAASAMGAATLIGEDFETPAAGTAVSTLTDWTGYGMVTASNYVAAVPAVGRPIDAATSNNVLVVEGRVARATTTAASKPTTVDMMVQIATPDDALAFPTGTTESDIQIAVGVETNATLKVYCKNKSDTAGWYSLGTTSYVVGSWHRVSFTFDYANTVKKLCQIRVDGDPILTANGYFSNDTSKNAGADGSWYVLNAGLTSLTNVQVIGSTAIDELLVKYDDAATSVDDVLPVIADADGTTAAASTGVAVKNDWIEQQGITRAAVTADDVAPDSSGMKISEKYRTGLSVSDGQKFEISAMSMKDEGGKRYATLTLPTTGTVPSGYANKVQYKTASGSWTDASVTASGTVDIEIPTSGDLSDPVIYVRLVNE